MLGFTYAKIIRPFSSNYQLSIIKRRLDMTNEKPSWIEIAKNPVTVLSIFLALVGGKFVLGIPFGSLTEVSKDGMKFSQNAKGEIASLSSQLNAATQSIEEIKKQLSSTPLSSEAKSKIFVASQIVSDQTAQIATVSNNAESGKTELVGFIWIGDYKKVWQRMQLISPVTNSLLKEAPKQIAPSSVFTLAGNMVLRDGLPKNDDEYFRGRKSIGVIPSGTRIKILAAPVAIDREFAVQYWVKVEVQP